MILLALAVFTAGPAGRAQTAAVLDLPDAPLQQGGAPSAPDGQDATSGGLDSSSSQSQSPSVAKPAPAETPEEQRRRAQEELKREEKQRILGVVPNFNTTNNQNAPPLTPGQKFGLYFHSTVDPFVFVAAGLDAAEEQAENDFPGYGQGAAGYAKRFGASYADTADGNLWGNAILPILLHEDPRYFRKGTGSLWNRALYSAATNVWSRRDNATWGPNFANVGGNFIAGGISNLYYPQSDRGFTLTITRALTVTAEGAIGSEFVEFWPDLSQHVFHKRDRIPASHPTVQPESARPVQQATPTAPGPSQPSQPQ